MYLHMRDFRDDLNANASEDGGGDDDDSSKSKPPDLIVGSCFADLFHPEDLIVSLKKIAKQGSPLLYFPITYGGMTTCSEMRPATDTTPSDARAFAIYNDALVDQGHNLDPTRIVSAIKKHGGAVLGCGTSVWNIDRMENAWMWKTMMYFFGTTAAGGFADAGYDISNWLSLFKRGRSGGSGSGRGGLKGETRTKFSQERSDEDVSVLFLALRIF